MNSVEKDKGDHFFLLSSLQGEGIDDHMVNLVPEYKQYIIKDDDHSGKRTAVGSNEPASPISEWSSGDDEQHESDEAVCIREKFKTYWKCAADVFGLTDDGMMLRKDADKEDFSENDKREISLWLIDDVAFPVENVLELGAGIGRFTAILMPLCKKITAIDFIKEYIEKNKVFNYDALNRPDDEFIEADATKLSFPHLSYALVFWNWLLMYVSDGEIKGLVRNAFRWLKVGGYLFCRESCGEPSDKNHNRPWAVDGNPTEYRSVQFYTWLLTDFVSSEGIGVEVIFKERAVSIYTEKARTSGQRCWLIKRIS